MSFTDALAHLAYGAGLNAILARAVARLLSRVPDETRALGGSPWTLQRAIGRCVPAVFLATLLVVLIVTIGGVAGLLDRPIAVLALTGALGVVVELAARRRPKGVRQAVKGSESAQFHATPWGGASIAIVGGLVAVTWIPLLCERITLPPVAWDALTYHLRYPVLWLQDGNLVTSTTPVGDASHTYFPLVGEMLLYWGMLSTGTDLWSSLSQVPFALLAAGAIVSLAIRCGADVRLATLAALCWLSTPSVQRQSVEPMVDLELAAFFTCTLLFGIAWWRGREWAWFYLEAASIGLLVGTKYAGILYALAAVPMFVWLGRTESSPIGSRGRTPARVVVLGIALAIAIGGYAYIRNWVAGGNPVLPLRLEVAGIPILPGPIDIGHYFGADVRRLGWGELLVSPRSILEMGPFFLPLLAILPLAIFLKPSIHGVPQRLASSIACAAILAFISVALILPYREHRYFQGVTVVAWSAAAMVASGRISVAGAGRIAVVIALAHGAVTLFYWGKDLLVVGVNRSHLVAAALVAGVCGVVMVRARLARCIERATVPVRSSMRARALLVAGPGVLILAVCSGSTVEYERSRFDLWYRYWSTRHESKRMGQPREDFRDMAASWRYLAELTRGRPTVVAYAGANIPYPLGGFGLRNRVLFAPRNENGDASWYRWGSVPPDPLTDGTAEAWRRNLDRLGVRYLCVYRMAKGPASRTRFPVEQVWADRTQGQVTLVWETPLARVYRVESAADSARVMALVLSRGLEPGECEWDRERRTHRGEIDSGVGKACWRRAG